MATDWIRMRFVTWHRREFERIWRSWKRIAVLVCWLEVKLETNLPVGITYHVYVHKLDICTFNDHYLHCCILLTCLTDI